jgi:hypothetical protein
MLLQQKFQKTEKDSEKEIPIEKERFIILLKDLIVKRMENKLKLLIGTKSLNADQNIIIGKMTDLYIVYKEVYKQVIQKTNKNVMNPKKREQRMNFLNEEKQFEVESNGNSNQIIQLEE